jgi:hypothetical protein
LVLYLDVAVYFITGKNLLDFRFSEIEKSIPIGRVFVAIAPYFLILYVAPKVRFWFQCVCISLRLNWILAKVFPGSWNPRNIINLIQDPSMVFLKDLKHYALRKNEQVLYHYVLSEEERDNAIWKMVSISFAFWALTIVEMSFPGLLLNDIFSQRLPEIIGAANTILLQVFVFIFALCQVFIDLAAPECGWVYLPDHPLSEKKEKELQDPQKAKWEREDMQRKLMEKAQRQNEGRPGDKP